MNLTPDAQEAKANRVKVKNQLSWRVCVLLRLSQLRKRREVYVEKVLHAKLSTNIGF